MSHSGVAPVYLFSFTVDGYRVSDCENFEIIADNKIINWCALGSGGWQKSLLTGKSLVLKVSGKRNYGNRGNDYVAGFIYNSGSDAYADVAITFPDESVMSLRGTLCVKELGGDALSAGKLVWELHSCEGPVIQ